MFFLPKKISSIDKSFFYRQFANLLSTDLSLTDIFEILENDLDNSFFEKVIKRISEDLKRKVPLHDCFARQTKYFGKHAPELLRICDEHGALKAALLMLARDQEWDRIVKNVGRNILIWPLFYLTGLILLLNLMMIFVIPVLEQMFNSFGGELPIITQITVSVGRWWWIIPMFVIFLVTVRFFRKYINWVALIVDWFVVQLPFVGKLSKNNASNKFVHTFTLLGQARVPVMLILEAAPKSLENRYLKRQYLKLKNAVDSGEPLSKALRNCRYVPNRLAQVVKITEKGKPTNEVVSWLETLYSEMFIEDLMKFQGKMQFILKWIIGILIGIVGISMYLPLFKMGGLL